MFKYGEQSVLSEKKQNTVNIQSSSLNVNSATISLTIGSNLDTLLDKIFSIGIIWYL